MPWRGPSEPGEFPTLGWLIGDWIEASLIIPDGPKRGQPFLLTGDQWRFLLWYYRLHPDAAQDDEVEAFVYYGAQYVRPQKAGKDPLGACQCCAEALGPVRFAGWDANGEPVGREVATPWVQCAATAEDQTDNTFRPIVAMLRDGPLATTPGLDVGETRIKLPRGDGWIEPVTSSARARLGARLTFASFTETHLMLEADGGVGLAKAMKRNLAGMGGRWVELTNAWDPSEQSVAQRTHESPAKGVLKDYRPPRSVVDVEDDEALLEELRYVYGDSAAEQGGWVRLRRIMEEIRDPATGEGEARRFFLNEVRVGSKDLVDPIRWDALWQAADPLMPGDQVCLGFDGSRARDATSLWACRLRDGKLFRLGLWEPPARAEDGWLIPRREVDAAVVNAFGAYQVWYFYGDPPRWQEFFDRWAGLFPTRYQIRPSGRAELARQGSRVVEFDTRQERIMDAAIERFLDAYGEGWLHHDGDERGSQHVKNAALAQGKKRPADEEGRRGPAGGGYYRRVVKKKHGRLIDAAVAMILALEARGRALEDGALAARKPAPAGLPPAEQQGNPLRDQDNPWRQGSDRLRI